MSQLEAVEQNIASLREAIVQSTTHSLDLAHEAEDTAEAAESLGAESIARALEQVKDKLDTLTAVLEQAADQAENARALTESLRRSPTSDGGSTTRSFPNAASRDPAAVPSPSSKRTTSRTKGRNRLTALTEQAEGIGDVTSYGEKVAAGVPKLFTSPPTPPEVTGTQTRAPSPTPTAAPAATSGSDLPSAAQGVATVGLVLFGWKYAAERFLHGIRTEEQTPEEVPPPPRARYPWEDEQRPNDT